MRNFLIFCSDKSFKYLLIYKPNYFFKNIFYRKKKFTSKKKISFPWIFYLNKKKTKNPTNSTSSPNAQQIQELQTLLGKK